METQLVTKTQLSTRPPETELKMELVPRAEQIEALAAQLPEKAEPYADKYFLRTDQILRAEKLNPFVRAQVMIRSGPGAVGGLDEAMAVITKYSPLLKNGGRIYALQEGESYEPGDTVMVIEGRIQDIAALETMYLGVISAKSTQLTDGIEHVDLESVREKMRAVVSAAEGREVMYFGARHWSFREDSAISRVAFEGGATMCSTDAGAATVGGVGVGTIPHVLENICAWKYGYMRAVTEATCAFDRTINTKVPRIALIDYDNREIDDSLATARALNGKLYGVRVDTCGENIAQGALRSAIDPEAETWTKSGVPLIPDTDSDAKYWYGNGVTVTGVYALRKALDEAGFASVKIVLSSGFADAKKVRAFVRAEKILGVKLFELLGVGGLFPSRAAKMDIVAAGESLDSLTPISKAGRSERPNPKLQLVLGSPQTT